MNAIFIACATITGVLILVMCLPLIRSTRSSSAVKAFQRDLYKAQLQQLDHDVASGAVESAEAEVTRLELHRRLLTADRAVDPPLSAGDRLGHQRLAALLSLITMLGAGALYALLGTPVPPQPDAAAPLTQMESPAAHDEMKEAAARLLQKLQAEPNNGERWALYGRTQSMLGEWSTAASAFRHAIDLGQNDADIQAGYGEMLVLSANGVVSPTARGAFVKALALDPANDVARYYVALSDGQSGQLEQAIAELLALAADLVEDSPMRGQIAQRLSEAERYTGVKSPPMPNGAASGGAASKGALAPDDRERN